MKQLFLVVGVLLVAQVTWGESQFFLRNETNEVIFSRTSGRLGDLILQPGNDKHLEIIFSGQKAFILTLKPSGKIIELAGAPNEAYVNGKLQPVPAFWWPAWSRNSVRLANGLTVAVDRWGSKGKDEKMGYDFKFVIQNTKP